MKYCCIPPYYIIFPYSRSVVPLLDWVTPISDQALDLYFWMTSPAAETRIQSPLVPLPDTDRVTVITRRTLASSVMQVGYSSVKFHSIQRYTLSIASTLCVVDAQ